MTAKEQKKSKADVIRTAIQTGLHVMGKQSAGGAETLMKLAEIGKKSRFRGVHDSSRMDELLWGKDWSIDE
ncbi:MAG: hypothetical protein EPN89_19770 [Methylovulum sp.]|nr:MAG: hypothetical protein EPN89_19770 [Methylovulum sp.]